MKCDVCETPLPHRLPAATKAGYFEVRGYDVDFDGEFMTALHVCSGRCLLILAGKLADDGVETTQAGH